MKSMGRDPLHLANLFQKLSKTLSIWLKIITIFLEFFKFKIV
jgi:hypothetical protein